MKVLAILPIGILLKYYVAMLTTLIKCHRRHHIVSLPPGRYNLL